MTEASTPVTIDEFMTETLCTVDGDLSLSDAQQRMEMNRIRHLAVLDGTAVAGVVSNRDLSVAAGMPGADPSKTPVSVAVIGPAHSVPVGSPITEVAATMEANRFGCVLVTNEGSPVGIFTTTDALRALRQLSGGEKAEPLSPHTIGASTGEGDPQQASRASAGAGLASHRAAPSPNDGKLR